MYIIYLINGLYCFYCKPITMSLKWQLLLKLTLSNIPFFYDTHLEQVPRDLFCLLNAERRGTEALVYRNHPREATASASLAIIFGRIASGVAWFLGSTAVPMQLPHQCKYLCWLWQSLKLPAIGCLTLCVSGGINGVTLNYCYS